MWKWFVIFFIIYGILVLRVIKMLLNIDKFGEFKERGRGELMVFGF